MEAPDKIKIVRFSDTAELSDYWVLENRTKNDDIEYINKNTLLEWLLKGIEMSEICHSEYGDACAQAYQAVIDKINSL